MRNFADIEREPGLKKFLDSRSGQMFLAPPPTGRLIVRRVDRELPPSLIPAWVSLHAATQAWLERDRSWRGWYASSSRPDVGVAHVSGAPDKRPARDT